MGSQNYADMEISEEEFNKISKDNDSKLEELRNIKNQLDDFSSKDKKDREDVERKLLDKKAEDVEVKLKKGEKITTEDLIKFQGGRD